MKTLCLPIPLKIRSSFHETGRLKSEVVKDPEKNSYSTVLYDDFKKFGDLIYETKQTFVSEDGNQELKIIDLYYNKKISEKDFK